MFWFSSVQWHRPAAGIGETQDHSQVMRGSRRLSIYDANSCVQSTPPLIVQAEAFASHLRPPEAQEIPTSEAPAARLNQPVPLIRPAAASAKFTLRATSVYPSQPRRSMALISEVGSLEGNERWVKEGSHVGHFVIHEIRQGAVVYRDGDQLCEMTVDVAAAPRRLVRDIRPGSRTASAAVEGLGLTLSLTPVWPAGERRRVGG